MKKFLFSLMIISVLLSNQIFAQSSSIRIGVSAPLSGDLAEYGIAVRNGIEIAKKEGGLEKLSFIYEDNQYDAKKSLSAFEKLRNDQVKAIFVWGETPYSSISPVAERTKMPLVAMSIDSSPAIGKKYSLRSVNLPSSYSDKSLEFTRKKGLKRIGIVKADDPFAMALASGVRKSLSAVESIVFEETVNLDESDFKSLLLKIKKSNVEVLGVYLLPGKVSLFIRQAASIGVKPQYIGTDVFESLKEIESANGAMEGSVYPNIKVPGEFEKRYVETYQNSSQITYAYNAYQFAKSLVGTPDNFDWNNSDAVLTYLKSESNPNKKWSYRSTKDEGNYFESEIVLKIIENGKFRDL